MTKVKTFTVGLPVTDLNSAVEWYRRLPEEVEEVNPAPGVWEFQIISSGWLRLFESEINQPNLAVVRLESDDIEASRMQALSLGTDVGEIETVPEAVRYFEFRDWAQGVRRTNAGREGDTDHRNRPASFV